MSDALGQISRRMTSTLELDEVLGEITRGLCGELAVALARIWLLEGETLVLAASAGLSERLDGSHARVAVGALKIGQLAATRKPLYVEGLRGDPRIPDQGWVAEHALVAFAGYPLEVRGELVGVLAIFSARALAADELVRLASFAAAAAVAIQHASLYAQVSKLSRRLEAENAYLAGRPARIAGDSAALQRVLREVARVAPTMSTVLLLGETGTGKELFARAVHEGSARRARPLVNVNCAALAPSLVESELFGHEKGAFTGAAQRRLGRFELAQGGTVFLDEIGELPLETQAKLLRVLQEHELERVGGERPIAIDVRVIAATNRDLAGAVKAGTFRSDLFYRLNVFPITIPPLRDRREDIPALVEHVGAKITPEALAYLQAYDWPGNVRELHNVVERATILANGNDITIADLPELGIASPEPGSLKQRVEAFERAAIAEVLAQTGGNLSEAARRLGTSRATLQYKVSRYGLH